MKKQRASFLFIACCLFVLFLGACSGSSEIEEVELDFGYDYYPLEIGRRWTYQVDSVIFTLGPGRVVKDTAQVYLREVIVDTTTGLNGETLYITERYHSSALEGPWRIEEVFTRSRSREQAFQTESNLRFIKLVFPVVSGKRWDGHAYFDEYRTFPVGGESVSIFKEWDYVLSQTGERVQRMGRSYEDVATVQQANYVDALIEYRWAQEQYARGIGLIYREWFLVDSNCRCCGGGGPGCEATPWQNRAENGFYLRQTLIEDK